LRFGVKSLYNPAILTGFRMLSVALRTFGRVHLVLAALALAVLTSAPVARSYGDRLQIALPLIAWACAAKNRAGTEFAIRFMGMMVLAHGTKAAFGEARINQRPGGGDKGFPSAHTSAATIGASSLVHDCIASHPVGKALVVLAAAFVGGTRIDAGKHDVWQVLAGGLLGWGSDRVLRRKSRMRERLVTGISIIFRAIRARLASARRAIFQIGLVAVLATSAAMWAPSARAEVEISLYGGVQSAPHSTIRDSVLGSAQVKWLGKSFDPPPYYGARVTWWRNDRFGFGFEFNHTKIYADNPAKYGYDVLEFTDGLNILTANIWRRWQLGGRITPYVGAGIGLAVPHVEVQPTGEVKTFGYQVTGPAVQVVAGAAWELNDRWSVFGEYKGTYSWNRATLDSGGSFETDIITNALNIGVSLRF